MWGQVPGYDNANIVGMVRIWMEICDVCGWQDVGMVIHESSVVSFLLCLVTFLQFHPFHF